MNIYSVLSIIAAITYLNFSFYFYYSERYLKLNRAWAAMTICLGFKSFFYAFTYSAATAEEALFYYKLSFIGWAVFPIAMVYFFVILTRNAFLMSKKRFIILLYVPVIYFITYVLSSTTNELSFIKIKNNTIWNLYNNGNLVIFTYFNVFFVLCCLFIVMLLNKWIKIIKTNRELKLEQVLRHTSLLSIFTCSITDILFPLLKITDVPLMAHILLLIWVVGTGYAVHKYNFLTITPAIASDKIISKITDFLILSDFNFKILKTNPNFTKILKYDDADIERLKLDELIVCDNGTEELNKIKDKTHSKYIFRAGIKNKIGAIIPVKITGSALYDDFDDPTGIIIYANDLRPMRTLKAEIENRKRAEAEIRKSQEKYQQIADNLPQTLFETDLNGTLKFVNKAGFEIFGYSQEDFEKGVNIFDAIAPQDRLNAKKRFELNLNLKTSSNSGSNYLMLRKNQTTFPGIVNAHPIFEDGVVTGLRGFIVDITELKKAEEKIKAAYDNLEERIKERTAELAIKNEELKNEIEKRKKMETELLKTSKLESISVMAGGIAHDFNNFLAGIAGNIEVAIMYSNSEKVTELLNKAHMVTLKAKAVTTQLLTFSKTQKPKKSLVNINDIVTNCADFTVRGTSIKCEFSINASTSITSADEGQITQVITNIILNSIQAMPDGGIIKLSTSNVTYEENRDLLKKCETYIKISIVDSGIGIDEKNIDKVFDPYFTTKSKGSGLGLASAYSIVNNHDGVITIDSGSGRGTTVNVFLPIIINVENSGTPINEKTHEKTFKLNAKVLVMDDEESIRSFLVDLFNIWQAKAQSANDGQEAIDKYYDAKKEGAPFDLLIFDLTVPGKMGGVEALNKIIKDNPDVIAIASSGYYKGNINFEYQNSNFKEFIAKPYHSEELKSIIKKIMPEKYFN